MYHRQPFAGLLHILIGPCRLDNAQGLLFSRRGGRPANFRPRPRRRHNAPAAPAKRMIAGTGKPKALQIRGPFLPKIAMLRPSESLAKFFLEGMKRRHNFFLHMHSYLFHVRNRSQISRAWSRFLEGGGWSECTLLCQTAPCSSLRFPPGSYHRPNSRR